MADLIGTLNDGAWAAVQSVLGGRSQGSVNNVGNFIRKVSENFSISRRLGEAYSRQNVLEVTGNRGDPVTNLDWIAVVVNKNLSLNTTLPWFFIDEITTPAFTVEIEEKFKYGSYVKYAKHAKVDSAAIKVYSEVNGTAFNFCNDWVRAIYRDDNLYQLPSLYKKDIYIYILDSTRNIVVDFKLLGCFPTSWDAYTLDSQAARPLETNLQLSVDSYRMNYDSDPKSIVNNINRTLGGVLTSATSTAISSVTGLVRNFF